MATDAAPDEGVEAQFLAAPLPRLTSSERVWFVGGTCIVAPPAWLLCGCCSDVLSDPASLPCGHTLCRSCAAHRLARPARTCPTCRAALPASLTAAALPTTFALQPAIDELRVRCRYGTTRPAARPTAADAAGGGGGGADAGGGEGGVGEEGAASGDPAGCPAILPLSAAASHELACDFGFVLCPFAGCGAAVRRAAVGAHKAGRAEAHALGECAARRRLQTGLDDALRRIEVLEGGGGGGGGAAAFESRLAAVEARLAAASVSGGAAGSGHAAAARAPAGGGELPSPGAWLLDALLAPVPSPRKPPPQQQQQPVPPPAPALTAAPAAAAAAAPGAGGWSARLSLPAFAGDVFGVAFSPDGAAVLAAGADSSLALFSSRSGAKVASLDGHGAWVRGVAWRPAAAAAAAAGGVGGCHQAASCSDDGTVRTWDVGAALAACAVVAPPNGATPLVAAPPVLTLVGHTDWVMCVAYSPDGARLASGGMDRLVKVWDVPWDRSVGPSHQPPPPGRCALTCAGHADSVWSVAFSPDGRSVASGSSDFTVKLWSAATGACVSTLQGHGSWVQAVAFAPDGRALLSGSSDGTMKVWDTAAAASSSSSSQQQQQQQPACRLTIAASAGAATGGGGGAAAAAPKPGAGPAPAPSAPEPEAVDVYGCCYSPDGARLLAGCFDGAVREHDARTGTPLATLRPAAGGAAAAAAGAAAAAARPVFCVAFAPDGRGAASGGGDGAVVLWARAG